MTTTLLQKARELANLKFIRAEERIRQYDGLEVPPQKLIDDWNEAAARLRALKTKEM